MLKEMKHDFSSLNNIVNSYTDPMKNLDEQHGQQSPQLETLMFAEGEVVRATTLRNECDKYFAVVTRTGKNDV